MCSFIYGSMEFSEERSLLAPQMSPFKSLLLATLLTLSSSSFLSFLDILFQPCYSKKLTSEILDSCSTSCVWFKIFFVEAVLCCSCHSISSNQLLFLYFPKLENF